MAADTDRPDWLPLDATEIASAVSAVVGED